MNNDCIVHRIVHCIKKIYTCTFFGLNMTVTFKLTATMCTDRNECPTIMLADSIRWWGACAFGNWFMKEHWVIIAKNCSHIGGTSRILAEKKMQNWVSTCNIIKHLCEISKKNLHVMWTRQSSTSLLAVTGKARVSSGTNKSKKMEARSVKVKMWKEMKALCLYKWMKIELSETYCSF